jgi:hypothetical protein
MNKTAGRLLALFVLVGLAACHEPIPPPYYGAAAPPPLQPYMGPATYATSATTRIVRRHYVRRRHYRTHCRCIPVR